MTGRNKPFENILRLIDFDIFIKGRGYKNDKNSREIVFVAGGCLICPLVARGATRHLHVVLGAGILRGWGDWEAIFRGTGEFWTRRMKW